MADDALPEGLYRAICQCDNRRALRGSIFPSVNDKIDGLVEITENISNAGRRRLPRDIGAGGGYRNS